MAFATPRSRNRARPHLPGAPCVRPTGVSCSRATSPGRGRARRPPCQPAKPSTSRQAAWSPIFEAFARGGSCRGFEAGPFQRRASEASLIAGSRSSGPSRWDQDRADENAPTPSEHGDLKADVHRMSQLLLGGVRMRTDERLPRRVVRREHWGMVPPGGSPSSGRTTSRSSAPATSTTARQARRPSAHGAIRRPCRPDPDRVLETVIRLADWRRSLSIRRQSRAARSVPMAGSSDGSVAAALVHPSATALFVLLEVAPLLSMDAGSWATGTSRPGVAPG